MHLKVASWPSVTVTFIIVFWIWGGPQVFTGQFGNHDDDDDDDDNDDDNDDDDDGQMIGHLEVPT